MTDQLLFGCAGEVLLVPNRCAVPEAGNLASKAGMSLGIRKLDVED